MALINCPECNKEISDKAEYCINCGYKLPRQEPKFQGLYCSNCLYTSWVMDKDDGICPFCKTKMINSIYGTYKEVNRYTENHPELKESLEFSIEAYNKRINYVPVEYGNSSSAKCPTCQSTNIRKISGLESGASIAMFGLFSRKINKSFKCNNCGYTW